MSQLLSISTQAAADGSITIAACGEVDLSTADVLRSSLSDGAQVACELTVDLSAVSFIDSTGLRVLLEADAAARSNGHSLRLAHPSRAVRRILEIAGLLNHLEIQEEAVESISAG